MLDLKPSVDDIESSRKGFDGPLHSLDVDNQHITLFTAESRNALKDLEQDIKEDIALGYDPDLYSRSRQLFSLFVDDGVSPVFSIPRQYIDSVLQDGLVPHETDIKGLRLLAGTFAIPPYSREDEPRYLAVLKNPQDATALNLQLRFTGPDKTWKGVVATRSNIPLEKLIIIDSANNEVVYDGGSHVDVLNNVDPIQTAIYAIQEGVNEDVQRCVA